MMSLDAMLLVNYSQLTEIGEHNLQLLKMGKHSHKNLQQKIDFRGGKKNVNIKWTFLLKGLKSE